MKDKLILKNEIEIELESGASLRDMRVKFLSWENMIEIIGFLTDENLSEVKTMNGDGIIVGRYENLVFEGETSKPQSDGAILTSIHFREKTDMEKRLDALEEGQEVNTGAIMDLGNTVSGLAEEGGFA